MSSAAIIPIDVGFIGLTPASAAVLALLTPAERKVAVRLAQGLSNKEIAHELGKSTGTVKNQLRSIYRKAGVRGRIWLLMRLLASS